MKMSKEYKRWRRKSAMVELERTCRLVRFNGRLTKAYKVPGTREAGRYAMLFNLALATAGREGWCFYVPASPCKTPERVDNTFATVPAHKALL